MGLLSWYGKRRDIKKLSDAIKYSGDSVIEHRFKICAYRLNAEDFDKIAGLFVGIDIGDSLCGFLVKYEKFKAACRGKEGLPENLKRLVNEESISHEEVTAAVRGGGVGAASRVRRSSDIGGEGLSAEATTRQLSAGVAEESEESKLLDELLAKNQRLVESKRRARMEVRELRLQLQQYSADLGGDASGVDVVRGYEEGGVVAVEGLNEELKEWYLEGFKNGVIAGRRVLEIGEGNLPAQKKARDALLVAHGRTHFDKGYSTAGKELRQLGGQVKELVATNRMLKARVEELVTANEALNAQVEDMGAAGVANLKNVPVLPPPVASAVEVGFGRARVRHFDGDDSSESVGALSSVEGPVTDSSRSRPRPRALRM